MNADAYRGFQYPLNVFMLILGAEEGDSHDLHYGLFESPDESLVAAQKRSTELLLQRLPRPPARLLEAGIGLGNTLARLAADGYRITGITPDASQIAMARSRHPGLDIRESRFEDFPAEPFDAIFFQESSQYIDAAALFAKAAAMTRHVVVLDEFAVSDQGQLHRYGPFIEAAAANGFRIAEEVDVSSKALPTVEYFLNRFERYREALQRELNVGGEQLEALIASGREYVALYATGAYVYRLVQFRR